MNDMNSGEWLFNSRYSRNHKEVDYYLLDPGGLYIIVFFFMFLFPCSFLKQN